VGGQPGLVDEGDDALGRDPHVDVREEQLGAGQTHPGGLDIRLHRQVTMTTRETAEEEDIVRVMKNSR